MRYTTVSILVVLMIAMIPTASAAEFDGLDYTLNYTELTGDISIVIDIADIDIDFDFQFNVEEDMPSALINEKLEEICDPDHAHYDAMLCSAFNHIFTAETLAWLDAQWNMHLNSGLTVLPQAIQTRQLPWPVDTFGTIYLVDYQLDWPCTWQSDAGNFETIPLRYSYDMPVGESMNMETAFGLSANGNIDRNANYALNGMFDFNTGLVITGEYMLIDIQFDLIADYTN